jgi:hypothetical protein
MAMDRTKERRVQTGTTEEERRAADRTATDEKERRMANMHAKE